MTLNFNPKKSRFQKSKLAGQSALAALAGALMLNQEASAQSSDIVDVMMIDGVASAQVQPDGSLLITTDNGQTYTVPQGSFTVQGTDYFVPANFADDLSAWATGAGSASGGLSPALIGLGVAAIGGVVAAVALSGDDDDDGVVVVPAPAPDPN